MSALPDSYGYIPDTILPEIFSNFLGQPSPHCRHLTGSWVGTASYAQPVDEYGNSIAASPYLPGGDFQKLSRSIQLALLGMAKQGGLTAHIEGSFFFFRTRTTHLLAPIHAFPPPPRKNDPRSVRVIGCNIL